MASNALPNVVVLGGGFGGLWTTRALARAPVRITLVDRANHHLFQPLLYQVATAGLSSPDIAAPLRHILRSQRNVTVRLDTVLRIDPAQRRVECAGGSLDYDYLVVATGATHAYFGHDDWAQHAPGLKTLDDALAIRRRVLEAFEAAEREPDPAKRQAWLEFVVIGGGPTGVELAGTLAEIAQHTLRNEFRIADPASARVHLVEAGPRVLASMPESLSASALRQLEKLRVLVHTGTPVTAIDAEGVTLGGTQRIESRVALWAAGVAASPLGAQLGLPCDRQGRVPVAPDLSLPGASGGLRDRRPRQRHDRWQAGSRHRARRQADGQPRRARDPRPHRQARHRVIPLPRLRQPCHHRPPCRRGRPARLQVLGLSGLGLLARRAPLLPDRLPQSTPRDGQLGVVVLELPATRADHRRADSAAG